MIIDVHGHFTQIPAELDAYRGRQIMQLGRPRGKGDPNISDDSLRHHLQPHVTQLAERGIDKVIWGPRAAFMGHEFGPEPISRFWTEVNNDLIARTVDRSGWLRARRPVVVIRKRSGLLMSCEILAIRCF